MKGFDFLLIHCNNMNRQQQFKLDDEGYKKRQDFRLQIRRKNISTLKKKIRNQFISVLTQQRQLNPSPSKGTIPLEGAQSPRTPRANPHPCLTVWEPSTSHPSVPCRGDEQLLNRVEELCLIDMEKLCTVQTVCELEQIVTLLPLNSISNKVHEIVTRICINESHWTYPLLDALLNLLLRLSHLGFGIGDNLVSLSECMIIDFKIHIYKLVFKCNILSVPIKGKETIPGTLLNSCIIRIVHNFLLSPPLVFHCTESLFMGSGPEMLPDWYINKIISLLTALVRREEKVEAITNIVLQEKNKQLYFFFEVLLGLLTRADGAESQIVVQSMKDSNWGLFQALLFKFEQRPYDSGNSSMETKIKFKILEIILTLLSPLNINKGTAINFLYAFLPSLLPLIISDIQHHFIKQDTQVDGDTKRGHLNQLKKKYQSLLLQVIITILCIRDELGDIPALQFIQNRYPSLFHNLYEVYFNHLVSDVKQLNFMCELTEILLTSCTDVGSLLPLAHFVENIILGRFHNPNKFILEDTLSAVLYFLETQQDQSLVKESILLITLKQNHILAHLEKCIYEGSSYVEQKSPIYEDLLIFLSHSQA